MIYQFHNVIPGLLLKKGATFLDLTSVEKARELQRFKGELKLKSMHLAPSGMAVERRFIEGLHVLKEALEETNLDVWGVKGELTGPITEAYSVTILPGRKKAIYDEEIFDIILKTTCEVASWLSSEIMKITRRTAGKDALAILFIDEPLLPLVLKEYEFEKVNEALKRTLARIKCRKGVHVCDEPVAVIDMLIDLEVDYFSFDMLKYPKTLEMADKSKIREHVENGRGFAFGVMPNTPEALFGEDAIYNVQKGMLTPEEFLPSPQEIVEKIELGLKKMMEKVDVKSLIENSLITPQCGFKSFTIPSPEKGEQIVRQLLGIQEEAAKKIREKYQISTPS
ncbi:MAG: hypothetical protein ACTSXC_03465 [Candidatus Freyarchaeota archaeon]